MNIGIIIPTTTHNTNWTSYKDTHLYNIFFKSFVKNMCNSYNYRIYLGIDSDDKIWNNVEEQNNILKFQEDNKNIKIFFVIMKDIEKGWVTKMWNKLFKIAYNDNCEYFYQCGDDIEFLNKGWVTKSVNILKNNNNIGLTGPLDDTWIKVCKTFNSYVHTQAFVSRKHMDIFKCFFPIDIKNWYCDNWITKVYFKNNLFYRLNNHKILNKGGKPRYEVIHKKSYGNNIDKLIKLGSEKIKKYK